MGRSVGRAISGPVQNITKSIEKVFTDPTKLTLGDALVIAQPVTAAPAKEQIENPESLATHAAVVAGATLLVGATAGGTILNASAAKVSATTSLVPGTSSAAYSPGAYYAGPAYQIGGGSGAGTLAGGGDLFATAGTFSGAGAAGASAGGAGFLSNVAAGFSTKGGTIGLGDALVNGISGIAPALTKTAPWILGYKLLTGQNPGGGGTGPGFSTGGFNLTIPAGIRDAGQSLLGNLGFPGFGQGATGSNANQKNESSLMASLPLLIFLGLAVGAVIYFLKKRR